MTTKTKTKSKTLSKYKSPTKSKSRTKTLSKSKNYLNKTKPNFLQRNKRGITKIAIGATTLLSLNAYFNYMVHSEIRKQIKLGHSLENAKKIAFIVMSKKFHDSYPAKLSIRESILKFKN